MTLRQQDDTTATYWVVWGPIRGECGHAHRTHSSAAKCLERDRAQCRRLGGGAYSDRIIRAVEKPRR